MSPAFARYERLLQTLPAGDLHSERHRAWCECALATFNGGPPEAVCLYWSDTADRLVRRVWAECGLNETEAVLFALGKHGARELNLSSDIDLLVVAEARDALAVEKGLRRFQQILQTPGNSGFCFRLDFDLRPGGKMGPLITTPSQFQDHYWSQGETWERLALVRLRALCGSSGLEKQITDLARRFSFRKFLDYTLLEDLKALRSQVHQKGFVRREGELHLKLEVGGIRDIELLVHSLLVLNGGKLPELQTRSTSEALRLLKQLKLLPADEADHLHAAYWDFRQIENVLQAFDDRQTHSLMAAQSNPALPTMADLQKRMHLVDKAVSALLGKVDLETVRLPLDEARQKIWLTELGFSEDVIASAWPQLMAATALSHKNDRDERARQEFLFSFVTELARNVTLDRDLGLRLLVDFVRATRAKATFFSMLLRSPRLIQDLARIFCLSPYLGAIVASRPELLDHFILQLDEAWATELEPLLQQMSERKLLTELWAANQFLVDRDLEAMFERITRTADAICTQLLVQLRREFPLSSLEIVALGKWAGRELGLRSDLDFIFVTPGTPNESDVKVARRMISRLTDVSSSGSLYDLDLRLRPSGQSGPLMVEVGKLEDYWRTSAAVWERQAYLRARPLGSRVLEKSLLVTEGLPAEAAVELREIRGKLLRAPTAEVMDLKYAPGGLLDIEFVVQTALLALRQTPRATSTLGMIEELHWAEDGLALTAAYRAIREFEQALQLSSTVKTSEARRASENFAKAAGLLGQSAPTAWSRLQETINGVRVILNRRDPSGFHHEPSRKL